MSSPDFIPLTSPGDAMYRAVEQIFLDSFRPEERMPFADLYDWLTIPDSTFQPILGAVVLDREVVGMGAAIYFLETNIGFLVYLAVRRDRREQGVGTWIIRYLLGQIAIFSRAQHSTLPRFTFWEAREPGDAPDEAERRSRRQRVQIYEHLGAVILPVDYTCPPLIDGQPPVRYVLMHYSYLPGQPITPKDMEEIAKTALITINHADPDGEYVRAAMNSLPTDVTR